jgi:hypothetical protein
MLEEFPGSDSWRVAVRWALERSERIYLRIAGDSLHYVVDPVTIEKAMQDLGDGSAVRELDPLLFGHVDYLVNEFRHEERVRERANRGPHV